MTSFEAFCAYLASHLKLSNTAMIEQAVLETTFDELGFDSLHIVEATMEAEKLFDVNVGDCEAHGCTTLGDLYNLCQRLAAHRAA